MRALAQELVLSDRSIDGGDSWARFRSFSSHAAATHWLQVKFHASDVSLMRDWYATSFPPLNILGFTLDDVHYILYLRRTDLKPELRACDSECFTGRLLPAGK